MSNALKHCEDASAIPAFVACIGDLADIQDNLKTGATDELVQHLPVLASKLAKYVIHCKDPSEVDIEQVEQFIECLQLFDHDRGLMSLRQDLKSGMQRRSGMLFGRARSCCKQLVRIIRLLGR
jgi:hypothetical protein